MCVSFFRAAGWHWYCVPLAFVAIVHGRFIVL